MLRLLGFATLVLIAICLAVSASIALADDSIPAATAQDRIVEAVDPDRRMIDESLASIEDVHEFDFAVNSDGEPSPDFDEPSDILEI